MLQKIDLVPMLADIARALVRMHRVGVMHRDIKSEPAGHPDFTQTLGACALTAAYSVHTDAAAQPCQTQLRPWPIRSKVK